MIAENVGYPFEDIRKNIMDIKIKLYIGFDDDGQSTYEDINIINQSDLWISKAQPTI